jgi:plastocyanin
MRSRRFHLVLFSAVLLATVVVGLPNLFLLPRVAAVNRTISLVGFVSAWNSTTTPNPTITVTQGDGVTLQLSSGDAVLHRWFVDVDKNGPTPDCPGADICSSAFSTSTVLTFTVNFAPGTYTYYCSVHPTTMLGQFVVNPSSSVGGTAQPVDRLALVTPYLGLASALAILVAVAAYIARTRRKEKQA